LRVAAMVDMVGEDDSIEPGRVASLLRVARADMPMAGDYDQATTWAGLRPATPDGAPIIGPSSVPGLWFNVGHGPLGFTFACGTSSILASLMGQGHSPLPLDGFTWAN
jgi:D-amino-acid dehydrogenase